MFPYSNPNAKRHPDEVGKGITMPDEKEEDLITSATTRLVKLGGLVGRVGTSVAMDALQNLFRSQEGKEKHHVEVLMHNASRVVATLGQMKGGAMKIGQMLSLQDGLFPPEVTAILRSLQQEAPPVPFSQLKKHIIAELGERIKKIKDIESTAYASASIGQIHRAWLMDGTPVILKVQYPKIDQVIEADLKNLKGVIGVLFSMFSKMDFDPIWEELRDHLHEELDYKHEARNMILAKALYKNNKSVVIPHVYEDLSTKRILCMEGVEGINPEEACSDKYSQDLRNQWGIALFETLISGTFTYRFLHADPNLANFAFLEDGRIILYDFGCVKRIPEKLTEQLANLVIAVLNDNMQSIPRLLREAGIHRTNGELLPFELIEDYARIIAKPFKEDQFYQFGMNTSIYDQIFELKHKDLFEWMDIQFPKDLLLVDRALIGHFGNLRKLKAKARWGKILRGYCE